MNLEQDILESFIERWGRYAVPEAGPQPIQFEQYMAWTPEECNKLELVDGRLLVGNPEDGTRRMLAFLMRAFGLIHTLQLAPASAWRPALAEIGVTLTPGCEWPVLPEPPEPSEADPVLARRQAGTRLALDVRLWANASEFSGRWLIGPLAVRPTAEAETVLIPDHLYIASERKQISQEYYLAGSPDWILEAPWPGGLVFCQEVKLPLYFQGDAQEVWMLDWGKQFVEVYSRADGGPTLAGRYGPSDHIQSPLFPNLSLSLDQAIRQEDLFRRASRGKVRESLLQLGRQARPRPEPQPLDIDRYAAWRPSEWHKLEIVDGQVYMGGTREEAERALALLLANVGLTEAARLAPAAHWQVALAQFQ